MSDKMFIVCVWGEEGLKNEIGFFNFSYLFHVAMAISYRSYLGWFKPTDSACIVIPTDMMKEKGIAKAIRLIFDANMPVDLRMMTETQVELLVKKRERK